MAVTDHSYDLDDRTDNFLSNDPDLPKWEQMHRETGEGKTIDGLILPGEEVSCGNARNENIHLLLLNNRKYYPGAGDSNERWFQNKPDLRIQDILEQMDDDTLAYAAHPGVPFAPLQRILLRRGIWHNTDGRHPKLNGVQFYNGGQDRPFRRGKKYWIRQLLSGQRLSAIAGNDAHGNFNRNRKLGQPFLYITESRTHTFGRGWTSVYLPQGSGREHLIEGLKLGRTCISTGPALELTAETDRKQAVIGGDLAGSVCNIRIRGKSSPDFGPFRRFLLISGDLEKRKERILHETGGFEDTMNFEIFIPLTIKTKQYLRAELITKKGREHYMCMTSPVWLKPG